MAYMNQERKAQLAAALKKVMPAGWKYTLSVRNHSTIVLTIRSAPVDILADWHEVTGNARGSYANVVVYHLDKQFDKFLPIFRKILAALNEGNHDNSDSQSDYFDVGWYVDIQIGQWGKPFLYTK